MKKNVFIIIIAIALSGLLQGCMPGMTGNGEVITETRDVSGFEEVKLQIAADVEIIKADNYLFEVEGESNILEILETRVSAGTLIIKFDQWSIGNHKSPRIKITMPSLSGVTVTGSGEIISESEFLADEFTCEITGSGDISLHNISTKNMKARISGSGDIKLANANPAEAFEMEITGSGDMDAAHFNTAKFNGSITGSGNCRVDVTEELRARISGSGDIHYRGNPKVDTRITGSGNVRPM